MEATLNIIAPVFGLIFCGYLMAHYVFDLRPLYVAVATIAAAMPVGANVHILAQKYQTYVARSASSVLLSTGLSGLSVTLLVALFAGLR